MNGSTLKRPMTSRSCLASPLQGEASRLRGLHQNSHALLDRSLGFGAEDQIIVVTDRMCNDREREPWSPRNLRHHLGRLYKAIGDNCRGGNPGVLGGHSVV